MAENDSGWSFTTGFLFGAIVGGIAGILLAPKPGSQTRAELLEQSGALRSRAEEMAASVRERVGPAVESVRERVSPAMESVRERVEPAVESVRERVEPAVESVRQKVAPVAKRVSARAGRGSSTPETDGGPGAEAAAEESESSEAKQEA